MSSRVAMLSLHTSPVAHLGRTRDAGGMNVYVRELSRELGRGGLAVDIFTRWHDPADPPIQHLSDCVRLIRVQAGPIAPLPTSDLFPYVDEFAHRVNRIAERAQFPYDVVHSHYWLSGVAALKLARLWDVPHITMFHTVERLKGERVGVPVEQPPAAMRRAEFEGIIAEAADRVIVASAHERDQLQRLYGLSPARVAVIPCGVDLRTFTMGTAAERSQMRASLGLGRRPVLLSVGRLDPIKGVDLLLDSVARMRVPATLVLVGGDPDGDPELDRLRVRVDELGLADRVRFLGAVPQRELPRFYRAADALVIASRYESFGLVAVESLACGTPVVASKVGGLPSIVRDGENGVLVPWRRAESFATTLDALLSDAPRLRRLHAAARPSVERFDWQHIGSQVRRVYAKVAAEQRVAEVRMG